MTNDIIESIVNYTDYLIKTLKLKVSFCNISHYFEKYMYILYQFNSHNITYCETIKQKPKSFEKCVSKQWNVLEKCKNGPFYGICWAGIEEYVFPIICNNIILGFVSVSGYRDKFNTAASRIKKVAEDYNFDFDNLYKIYTNSTTNLVPNFANIKTIISPLAIMFERLYLENPIEPKTISKEFSFYEKILEYISRNYLKNPTLEEIAKNMHYSVSYIRQTFKKKSNHTIGEYISQLKINKACDLLINTSYSVSTIASMSGFVDSNYFSTKFNRYVKMTPLEYRKLNASNTFNYNIEKLIFYKSKK